MNTFLRIQTLGVHSNDNKLPSIVVALETTEVFKWFMVVSRVASSQPVLSSTSHTFAYEVSLRIQHTFSLLASSLPICFHQPLG